MTPKEKALDLVDKFFMPIPLTHQVLTNINNIPFEYDDWEVAKKCALIAVDEILDKDGYNNDYWKKVKQQIKKL